MKKKPGALRTIIPGSWNIVRILRLAIGIIITAQGIWSHEWVMAAFGGLFSLMPLLNTGCCAGNSCTTSCNSRPAGKAAATYKERP